jgi:hypothetical protein
MSEPLTQEQKRERFKSFVLAEADRYPSSIASEMLAPALAMAKEFGLGEESDSEERKAVLVWALIQGVWENHGLPEELR